MDKSSQVFLRYIEEAKIVGSNYNKKFVQESTIHKYKTILKYLQEKKLFSGADKLLQNFNKFIERS